jgi:outer membrane protein OmpA-like peptidoglycan-associated protein
VTTAAQAQSVEDNYPYNFVSLQGGAQATLTHYKFTDLITPQAAVSFGRYFNSKVGARLHVQGWQIKSGFKQDRFAFLSEDKDYKFNAITGDLDLLVNMTNVLNPNRLNDKFDWVLLAGFGVNYAWDFDEFNRILPLINDNNYYVGPEMCGTKHSTFNGRFGTQFNYNPDWQVQALLGLTFKFGCKKAPKEVEEVYYEDEPYTDIVKKQRPVETVEVSKMEKVVYYQINVSDVETAAGIDAAIKEAADLIKTDPNAKIFVTGYADVQTGNPTINERLSRERAEGVTAKLVNEHGINAANITTDWKGDTVQPFPVNDENRCVIIKGEGKFQVTKYEQYEEKVEKVRQVKKTRMVKVQK